MLNVPEIYSSCTVTVNEETEQMERMELGIAATSTHPNTERQT